MDLLLSTGSKSGKTRSSRKGNLSEAKENSNLSTKSISVEETQLPISATTSKSDEIGESYAGIEYYSQVVTKTESSGARDIKSCFCCFWIFPQSFRGEEKNIHMDRCMEGFGDQDKKWWMKCKGDLKQYRHNFGVSEEQFPKRRTSKSSKKNLKDMNEFDIAQVVEPKQVLKKRRNKKDLEEETEMAKPQKRGGKKKDIELDDGEPKIIEIEVSKKSKANGAKQEKDVAIVIEEKKPIIGLGYTKIIAVPLVTELIFNPSKEFEKFLRK